jgi:hypothetical protein
MNVIHGIRADTSSTEQNLPYPTVFMPAWSSVQIPVLRFVDKHSEMGL